MFVYLSSDRQEQVPDLLAEGPIASVPEWGEVRKGRVLMQRAKVSVRLRTRPFSPRYWVTIRVGDHPLSWI